MVPAPWVRTLWSAQSSQKVSLWVDSSPTRSWSPRQVRQPAPVADHGGVERAAQGGVGGQEVLVGVADERDAVGDRLQRPPQAGHAPAAGDRETDLVRCDAGAASGQELASLLAVVHDLESRRMERPDGAVKGCPVSTPNDRDSRGAGFAG